ncbi:hypothetical protein SAMN02910276_03013 [Butyrivibrio sp. Su6]|uniref:hypothetical protein n=1 Tax=Butyrivibrio sp. Su6 TaxID=1520810 RepID=UPI00089EA98F|nr:hypothetical protein [Butyrivibrio sp. Su6]SEG45323.1 hypothetical protein SAMN02910276_03013 [Butyrivibrio sp. Su6]
MNRKILMRVTSLTTAALFGCAFAVTSTFGGNVITARANGLTQTADASKVSYGTTSESDIALLKQIFDLNYYRKNNPELEALFGDNYNAWFEHFYRYGIYEGRTCSENFDPSAYASAYSDLKAAFGSNILEYYKFYLTEGKDDPNRQITTLKQCADNGITVQALTDSEVRITPQLYAVAEKFGTQDFKAVSTVVQRAIVEAAAVGGTAVISNGEESVVITDDGSSSSNTSDQKAETPASSDSAASGSSEETKPSSDSDVSGSSEETSGGSSESSGDSQQSSDTTGGGSAAVNVLDGYQITKTLTVGDYSTNFTIEIYRGSKGGYGAWGVTSICSAENPSTTTELMDKTENYTYSDTTDDGYGDKVASVNCSAYSMGSSSSSSEGEAESGIGIGVYASDATYNKIDGNIIQNTGTSRTETSEWEGGSETYTMIVDPNGTTDTVYGVGVNLEETDTGVEATVAVGGSDGYGLEESFDVQVNISGNE